MGRLALALISLALFVALGESVTRFLDRGGALYDVETHRYARLLTRPAPEVHHLQVPGASAVLQGVDVRINSHGLRDREFAYTPPAGVKRLLLMGDSVTFGWGVAQDLVYAKVCERELAKSGRYEVIDAAVVNHTTARMLAFYRQELYKYGAPVVLVAFFINNANEAPDSWVRAWLDTPLELPVFLYSRLRRVTARGPDFDTLHRQLYAPENPLYQAFAARLTAFIRELAAQGKQVIVINVPDAAHLDEPVYRYQSITDTVLGLARTAGAQTIDLYPAVRGMAAPTIVNSAEDRHPNAEGHRRMGVYLAQELKRLGI